MIPLSRRKTSRWGQGSCPFAGTHARSRAPIAPRRVERAGGIWSTGSLSTLALAVDNSLQGKSWAIEFHLTPFLAPGHPAVTVELFANGRPVETKGFSGTSPEFRVWFVVLSKGIVNDNQRLELTLKVQSPASPASLGLSSDLRPLGVMLHELRLSPVAGS